MGFRSLCRSTIFMIFTIVALHANVFAASPSQMEIDIRHVESELEHVTKAIDAILSYAVNPRGTIQVLSERLDKEQIQVGLALQKAKAEGNTVELKNLELRYSEIFNEIIEVRSYGRLPKSLIGSTREDVVALFERRWRLTQQLEQLKPTSSTPKTCGQLFQM